MPVESDRGREAAILSRHIPPEWMAYLRGGGILEKLRNSDDVMYLDQGLMARDLDFLRQ